ncbi:ABC transporter permease [Ancylobacter dichloromethanicus]|uniref:Osmoprotectant uptake system permease n=1 Tax=Ancylobacter dichloromethanicus TaxID=518825 RepID=A0A9W6J9D0_9HYPH|nr:ABC transporter permease [Ancylobacter dichloromethanicus]MBS7552774.1 ABC transporter permease [Ancylobacter dichloromethanicus]GLK72138.1 osmoprotectant uptake system permease [Ancylobacter dichloromethanicus]
MAAARPGGRVDALPLLLAAIALAAVAFGGFIVVAPNRLLSGAPLTLWQAQGAGAPAAVLTLLALIATLAGLRDFRFRWALIGLAAGALVIAAMALAGLAAAAHAEDAGRLTRVSLGAGFWTLLAAGLLILADAVGRERSLPGKVVPVLATGLGMALLMAGGTLSQLSLAREYAVRHQAYLHELLRHLELTGAGLALALLIGGAIGLMAYRRPRRAGSVFAVLDIVQTIPSLALFALLIGPLTALTALLPGLRQLGISGIGPFPAILALGLYGLLPVARGVHAGLSSVPNAVVEAARGMGLTEAQIVRHTLVPLALPTLFQTLRITLVQLIGLAVLAALIGAGGLGTFIFQGLGQTAVDLVLLGALSAIVLALLADIGLRGLAFLLFRRPAR